MRQARDHDAKAAVVLRQRSQRGRVAVNVGGSRSGRGLFAGLPLSTTVTLWPTLCVDSLGDGLRHAGMLACWHPGMLACGRRRLNLSDGDMIPSRFAR